MPRLLNSTCAGPTVPPEGVHVVVPAPSLKKAVPDSKPPLAEKPRSPSWLRDSANAERSSMLNVWVRKLSHVFMVEWAGS